MKLSKQTRKQRALDIRALLARNAHLFSLKDACEHAEINYESTSNAISRLIRFDDTYAVSDERLDRLETAVTELSEQKAATA